MTIASKEIKKFYDKILRSKEVQKALKYANESVEHDIREDLQEVSLGNNMLRKDFLMYGQQKMQNYTEYYFN